MSGKRAAEDPVEEEDRASDAEEPSEVVELDDDSGEEKEGDEAEAETKEGEAEAKSKENGEQVASKRTLLRPLVVSVKERLDQLFELTDPEVEAKDDNVTEILSEARKARQLVDDLISMALRKPKRARNPADYQYVAKIQGLRAQHLKDLRNILQNALGLGTMKFSPVIRNSPFIDVNFFSEEVMNKGLKIIRNKPLGLSLSVVETKMLEKARLPPECVLKPLEKEYDATVMLRESLLRSRELTEEEYNKVLEWKEKFVRYTLTKMCETLDPDIYNVIKDRTDEYFFKLEKIRASGPLATTSERYQTFSGVGPDEKLEMGYWVLGSDVPSRIPRSECIRNTLKVLTDFMESSSKPFFDLRVRKGFWESIMFRTNHEDECMVLLIVHSEGADKPETVCEAIKPQLSELFSETGPGKDCKVKSIHMKVSGESNRAGAWHHVHGEEFLDDEVAGLKLRLHMNSLFWTDSGCTQDLCEAISDQLGLDQETGVLEMGIATGLICMFLAKRCKVVCGMDRVPAVIPLAKANLELNEVTNVELVQSSAATTFSSLKTHFKECENVHAFIMETSSNARNREEVVGIRKATWIKKVAYLIILYKDVTSSLRQLCSKHLDSSEPFVITKVIPFDTAAASFRPDILLIMERLSALEDQVEKRVPKTKPKPYQLGPAAKRPRLGDSAPGHPRSLLSGKRFRPPLIREPGMSSRVFMGRGFGHNQDRGYGQQRGGNFGWSQGDVRRPLLTFDNEPAARLRAMEEAEALLIERARRQKEEQIQQLQEVVIQAQRRQLADALLPTPPAHNIEEVVLTAIKKTGLLEKVAALSDAPKSRMDVEGSSRDSGNWGRYNERESPDRWQSGGYNARASDSRRYGSRDSSDYQDRSSYNYGRRAESPEHQGRGSGRYQKRGSFGYQDRSSSGGSSYKSRGGGGGGYY